MWIRTLAALALAVTAVGCGKQPEYPAPPRSESAPEFAESTSTITVPVTVSLDELQRSLESSTPRRLWSINQRFKSCVPAQRVKAFGRKLKVTPDIACTITGQVTRGTLKLSGKGSRIAIRMPVSATISANDVGGIIKKETATGSAVVNLTATLRVDSQWNPHAKVDISYNWTDPPGIDILGHRIKLVSRADKELAKVVHGLERDLERRVSQVRIKPVVAGAWKQGFAVINLNREKPPAWMRVTPLGIGFDSYAIEGRSVRLMATLNARTETFVQDDAPEMPEVTPLPPQRAQPAPSGFRFFIPVIAEYAQLEPVLLRALQKLAAEGVKVEKVGRVEARFDKVTLYATDNNRLAVGVDAEVTPIDAYVGKEWGKSKGRIWLVGEPYNEAGSQVIRVRNLAVFGNMDKLSGDLLVRLMSGEEIRQKIEAGIKEDFAKDYDKVLEAGKAAIAERREGDFRITTRVEKVEHGTLQVTGKGLFLPVEARGDATIRYVAR